MIVEFFMDVVRTIFLDPMVAVLPEWSIDFTMPLVIRQGIDESAALIPYGQILETGVLFVQVGLIVMPFVFVLWLYNVLKP